MGIPSPTGRAGATFSPTPVTVAPVTAGDGRSRKASVACTLDGADLGERTEQWRALLAKAERHEAIDDGPRLSFAPDAELAGFAPDAELAGSAPDAELAGRLAALGAAGQGC
ncbi:hypothetical protein [Streptomyces sp. NBC_01727]|uniref:hypothetical protein n=1 Tax=unclassified Streptomyces TaxID=2593676 RepID=UPI002E152086|nr:hypothetical protein OIE76_01400 [Streptomyces sp. NBC_01727]